MKVERIEPSEPSPYQSIQIMRGVAAMLVVLYHCGIIMAQPEYGGTRPSFDPVSTGWIGVNFFFVLSGFIILHAHAKDIGTTDRLRNYAWRRFSRVYPLYWTILTIFILASALGIGHAKYATTPLNILTAYTLMPFEQIPSLPLKVAWTLLYEIQFYVVFGVAIVNARVGAVVVALWTGAIALSIFLPSSTDEGFPYIWGINFFFGGAAYYVLRTLRQGSMRFGILILASGALGLITLTLAHSIPDKPDIAQSKPIPFLLLGASFTAFVIGSVIIERARAYKAPFLLTTLGNASYSIYLVHSAAISVLLQLHGKLPFFTWHPNILFFILAVIATLAGVVTHFVVERPLLQLMRSKRLSK